MNTLAVILAGGAGTRLGVLTQKRAKPAVPFGGKYRIIDFALSNCAHSGVSNVGILTQYEPRSLNNHVGTGRPWDLDHRSRGGITLLPPYRRIGYSAGWYRGTADAVYQNLDFVWRHSTEAVLVLSGDHIYKMDYTQLLRYHQERRADVTVCAVEVPREEASRFGMLVTDADGRVVEFQEKPQHPRSNLASMGVYVFQTELLARCLAEDAGRTDSEHDFGRDVLPCMLDSGGRIFAYPFEDYWVDVGTVQAYWQANMDLLLPDPPLRLTDAQWRVYTPCEGQPPASICAGATVSNSLISEGCIIEGWVENSVLSPGVHVQRGAVVRNSVIFGDCVIGSGAVVDGAILDKNVVVGRNAQVGVDVGGRTSASDAQEIAEGLTLVGKNTRLPAALYVGRGRTIDSGLTEDVFLTDRVFNRRIPIHQPGNNGHAARRALVTAPLLD